MTATPKQQLCFYSVVIEPCEEGGYFGSCPALQGCHAEGETYGEALDNLHNVIKIHLEEREKDDHRDSFVAVSKTSRVSVQFSLPVSIAC
jgi:predicted RNase H-like HicB family nuclease